MKKEIMLIVLVVMLVGCTSQEQIEETEQIITGNAINEAEEPIVELTPESDESEVDEIRVKVYHFHGTHQCNSCIMVGDLAEKTVHENYADLIESGAISFAHINGELPENRALVEKYGVSSASLWIGTYKDGEFHKEQNMNVWYKINDEEGYKAYLKELLDKRLQGDLS